MEIDNKVRNKVKIHKIIKTENKLKFLRARIRTMMKPLQLKNQ